jgi:hypothetical protein
MTDKVCIRLSEGPFCSHKNKESTPAEKTDCLQKAYLNCLQEAHNCIAEKIRNVNYYVPSFGSPILSGAGVERSHYTTEANKLAITPLSESLDDLDCYQNISCGEAIKQCYCLSGGQQCIICSPEPVPEAPVEDPKTPIDPGKPGDTIPVTPPQLKTSEVTVSKFGVAIPVIFGTVYLSGNLIAVNKSKGYVVGGERVDSSGKTINVPIKDSVIDFHLALAEGLLNQPQSISIGNRKIFDANSFNSTQLPKTFIEAKTTFLIENGTETQKTKPYKDLEWGKIPAYRGLAYLSVKNFPLVETGGTFPDISVKVSKKSSASKVNGNLTSYNVSKIQDIDSISGRFLINSDGALKIGNYDETSKVTIILDASFSSSNSVKFNKKTGDFLVGVTTQNFTLCSGYYPSLKTEITSTDLHSFFDVVSSSDGYSSIIIRRTDSNTLKKVILNNDLKTVSSDTTVSLPNIGSTDVIVFSQMIADESMYLDVSQNITTKAITFRTAQVETGVVSFYSSTPVKNETLNKVIYVKAKNYLVLFYTTLATFISLNDYSIIKTVKFSEFPLGELFLDNRQSNSFYFISQNLKVVKVDTLSNNFSVQGSLSEFSLNTYSGLSQLYNEQTGKILFTETSGKIYEFSPVYVTQAKANLNQILSYLSASLQKTITSSINPEIEGYVLDNQLDYRTVLMELSYFFGLKLSSSNGVIELINLATTSVSDYSNSAKWQKTTTEKEVVNFDLGIEKVEIFYRDHSVSGSVVKQIFSPDWRPFDTFRQQGKSLSFQFNIYTDKDTAQALAEFQYTNSFVDKGTLEFVFPFGFDIQSSDRIKLWNNKTYFVNKVFQDFDNLSIKVSAVGLSDEDIFLTTKLGSEYPASYSSNSSAILFNRISKFTLPLSFNPFPSLTLGTSDSVFIRELNPFSALSSSYTESYTDIYDQFVTSKTKESGGSGSVLIGRSANVLSKVFSDALDTSSVVTVNFLEDVSSFFTSMSASILVGSEWIQFSGVLLSNGNKTAQFSKLIRGVGGTSQQNHSIGEICLFLTDYSKYTRVLNDKSTKIKVSSKIASDTMINRTSYLKWNKVNNTFGPVRNIRITRDTLNVTAEVSYKMLDSFNNNGQKTSLFPYGEVRVLFLRQPFNPNTIESILSSFQKLEGNFQPLSSIDVISLALKTTAQTGRIFSGRAEQAYFTDRQNEIFNVVAYVRDSKLNRASEFSVWKFESSFDTSIPQRGVQLL